MGDERRQLEISERLEKALALEHPDLRHALGHRPRLELLAFLMERGERQPTSEQELAEAFGMSIPLVEYHLKVLEHAELIANVADEQAAGTDTPRYVVSATL